MRNAPQVELFLVETFQPRLEPFYDQLVVLGREELFYFRVVQDHYPFEREVLPSALRATTKRTSERRLTAFKASGCSWA